MATKAVSIKLDETDQARLASLAQARKRSSHFLMREAIAEYLEREEHRAAFIAEAETAWQHYHTTGEHVNTGRRLHVFRADQTSELFLRGFKAGNLAE
ncbi:MAG: ribbon-helix-helix domain-containing protein [Hyphomicrobiales bacterium]